MRHVSALQASIYAFLLVLLSLSMFLAYSSINYSPPEEPEDIDCWSEIESIKFESDLGFVPDFESINATALAAPADFVWRVENEISRSDGPAIIRAGCYEAWVEHGLLHRVDGPALTFADGSQAWYISGVLHREDGPAMELSDGSKAWLINGVPHNEFGPSIVHSDGREVYYVDGMECTYDEFLYATYPEFSMEQTGEDSWIMEYRKNGELHRLDGPALLTADGLEAWYRHGVLHRVDGPAFVFGIVEEWHFDGKLHRDDGPAVKVGEYEEYWVHGEQILPSEEGHFLCSRPGSLYSVPAT